MSCKRTHRFEFECIVDERGNNDLYGNELKVTQIAIADELAAASSLLMGQAAQKKPVVIIKNYIPQKYPGTYISHFYQWFSANFDTAREQINTTELRKNAEDAAKNNKEEFNGYIFQYKMQGLNTSL